MEYLDGESLADRRHRLSRIAPARAIALMRQVAGALAVAHERGIVHRDLKPDNLFVVADPEVPGGERIKILDFGIAKLARSGEASRTQTGSVLGTPTYMAPEQCRGAADVDARADLYALGCVTYELICGRPPFVVDGAGEQIAHHLYFEPDPPHVHEPSIPPAIEALILALLRKRPEARPESARAVIEMIDRIDTPHPSPPQLSPTQPTVRVKAVALPTTLSGATGVSLAIAATAPRRRWWAAPAVAIGVVAAAIGAFVVVSRGGEDVVTPAGPASAHVVEAVATPPSPVSAPADAPAVIEAARTTPPPVHVRVDSTPAGATVMLDGAAVGTTPFDATFEPGAARRMYMLRRDGFEPAVVAVDPARDSIARVSLERRRVIAVPKPSQPVGDSGVNPFE
jgi:serine/threonine-protein kinase